MSNAWFCKIGGASPKRADADWPMREAISKAFQEITGEYPEFIFSGWGYELTEPERAVVENREPVRSELKLFSFFANCGRMGDVEGLFIAKQSEVDAIIGEEIYFGEILGKHSEVVLEMEQVMFQIESDDQEKVQWLLGLLGSSLSGYNPLDYQRSNINNNALEEDDE